MRMMDAAARGGGTSSEAALIEMVCQRVGRAPVKMAGATTSVRFLKRQCPGISDAMVLSEVACIDLSQPVRITTVPRGGRLEMLVRHSGEGHRIGNFATDRGTGGERLGHNTTGKVRVSIEFTKEAEVLESRRAPARDTFSLPGVTSLEGGGGKQYRLPARCRDEAMLKVVTSMERKERGGIR